MALTTTTLIEQTIQLPGSAVNLTGKGWIFPLVNSPALIEGIRSATLGTGFLRYLYFDTNLHTVQLETIASRATGSPSNAHPDFESFGEIELTIGSNTWTFKTNAQDRTSPYLFYPTNTGDVALAHAAISTGTSATLKLRIPSLKVDTFEYETGDWGSPNSARFLWSKSAANREQFDAAFTPDSDPKYLEGFIVRKDRNGLLIFIAGDQTTTNTRQSNDTLSDEFRTKGYVSVQLNTTLANNLFVLPMELQTPPDATDPYRWDFSDTRLANLFNDFRSRIQATLTLSGASKAITVKFVLPQTTAAPLPGGTNWGLTELAAVSFGNIDLTHISIGDVDIVDFT